MAWANTSLPFPLVDLKYASSLVMNKVDDCRMVTTKGILYITGRAIAQADPDHLGRKATENAHIAEIGILGDNGVVIRLGMQLDRDIRGAIQPGE
jgi:hypothetical protein